MIDNEELPPKFFITKAEISRAFNKSEKENDLFSYVPFSIDPFVSVLKKHLIKRTIDTYFLFKKILPKESLDKRSDRIKRMIDRVTVKTYKSEWCMNMHKLSIIAAFSNLFTWLIGTILILFISQFSFTTFIFLLVTMVCSVINVYSRQLAKCVAAIDIYVSSEMIKEISVHEDVRQQIFSEKKHQEAYKALKNKMPDILNLEGFNVINFVTPEIALSLLHPVFGFINRYLLRRNLLHTVEIASRITNSLRISDDLEKNKLQATILNKLFLNVIAQYEANWRKGFRVPLALGIAIPCVTYAVSFFVKALTVGFPFFLFIPFGLSIICGIISAIVSQSMRISHSTAGVALSSLLKILHDAKDALVSSDYPRGSIISQDDLVFLNGIENLDKDTRQRAKNNLLKLIRAIEPKNYLIMSFLSNLMLQCIFSIASRQIKKNKITNQEEKSRFLIQVCTIYLVGWLRDGYTNMLMLGIVIPFCVSMVSAITVIIPMLMTGNYLSLIMLMNPVFSVLFQVTAVGLSQLVKMNSSILVEANLFVESHIDNNLLKQDLLDEVNIEQNYYADGSNDTISLSKLSISEADLFLGYDGIETQR